jgi:hypothetical protein
VALKYPKEINILGIRYKVEYCDNPSDVDPRKQTAYWGYHDTWTRTIRVYNNGRPPEDVWQVIWHEAIHAIAVALHLDALNEEARHDDLDVLALALVDTMTRNGWWAIDDA